MGSPRVCLRVSGPLKWGLCRGYLEDGKFILKVKLHLLT